MATAVAVAVAVAEGLDTLVAVALACTPTEEPVGVGEALRVGVTLEGISVAKRVTVAVGDGARCLSARCSGNLKRRPIQIISRATFTQSRTTRLLGIGADEESDVSPASSKTGFWTCMLSACCSADSPPVSPSAAS